MKVRRLTIGHASDLTRTILTGELADLRALEERAGEDVVVMTLEEWTDRDEGAAAERRAVVAWLRMDQTAAGEPLRELADDIERGEHRKWLG